MTVHLVIAEADVYERQETRIMAVTRTKTAAFRMRRDHRREVESRISQRPQHPGNFRDLPDYIEKNLAWEAEAERAARAAMPGLPWQLWATRWRVETHEVVE